MYADRWSPGLRQGDIVGRIFFPALGAEIQAVTKTRSLVGALSDDPQEVQVPGDQRFVVIASHDCEFNERKRNRLLVARIERVPGNLTQEQRVSLRESNDVEARAEQGAVVDGVDSFVLDPLPGFFEEEQVAVFTTLTPLSIKMHDDLAKVKRAELRHETRVLFRKKLAWFFGRHADDIADADKFEALVPEAPT